MTSCVHLEKKKGLVILDWYFGAEMESNSTCEKDFGNITLSGATPTPPPYTHNTVDNKSALLPIICSSVTKTT